MVSRTQVANYVAEKLPTEREAAIRAAASWLVVNGRKGQTSYLARDVARALATRGYVLVRVVSARPLGPSAKARIVEFIKIETGASELELETVVDPKLIGGVRIETPSAQLDGSVRASLAKFVEGVSQ